MRLIHAAVRLLTTALTMAVVSATGVTSNGTRCLMYLTGQHPIIPAFDLASSITHVNLAFLTSDVFTAETPPDEYPLFMTVDQVRAGFKPGTKVLVAIGGWGDWKGFQEAALTAESRKKWAEQVKIMVDKTGADGVDIDWEYPGGNRDDYKEIPNSEREWEIEAFVALLQQLRAVLGKNKLLTIATPGKEIDLMAFTTTTLPRIVRAVDFINVMTYDMMNRRDTTVQHHSGIADSRDAIQRYVDRGAKPHQLNVGLGYYVKWFLTTDGCDPSDPIGCPTLLLEDPNTGADLGRTGGFSYHDETPSEVVGSFQRAQNEGIYTADGSYGYWDKEEARWWSFDTPKVIESKMAELVGEMGLGGAFAWGLGEDAPDFDHLEATINGLNKLKGRKSEL
ncbi:unnamed protein product [Clonostachys rosea f. rosea IK726]|uniref:chitinase n=2 Tax=Bionectria ochroleuca TaxID=29856 RepID=A0A0B7KCB4_BIOOC|nr:unnamed protein product [Clonostachys rosea f. rosea IK726]